jgi:DNA-binding beta-propeller fold protein YncE
VAVTKDGDRVVVVDRNNNRIQRFTPAGAFIDQIGSAGAADGQFATPLYVALDGANNLHVSEFGNNRVSKFSANGVFVAKTAAGQLNAPRGVAVVPGTSEMYVGNSNGAVINKFNSAFAGVGQWGVLPVWGIAVDNRGRLFAPGNQQSQVRVYNSTGGQIASLGPSGSGPGQFQFPVDVAVDRNGYVYVMDFPYRTPALNSAARIQRFSPELAYVNEWLVTANGLVSSSSYGIAAY